MEFSSEVKIVELELQNEGEKTESPKLFLGFSKRHLVLLGLYGLAAFFRGVVTLIAGPFFPPEVSL